MLVVLGDTYREADNGLRGKLLDRVRKASTVIHSDDLVTVAVLESFRDLTAHLVAVHGTVNRWSQRHD